MATPPHGEGSRTGSPEGNGSGSGLPWAPQPHRHAFIIVAVHVLEWPFNGFLMAFLMVFHGQTVVFSMVFMAFSGL